MKIVAATTVNGPYIAARYRRFAEVSPDHELTLLEFGRLSGDYSWDILIADVPYTRKVIAPGKIEQLSRATRISLITSALDALQPDALVVCGYGVPGMAAAIRWARERQPSVPIILLSDSTEIDRKRTSWREWVKSRLVAQCSTAVVAGQRHRAYLERLGFPAEFIFDGYDVVDNDHFSTSTPLSNAQLDALGLSGYNFFLGCSRFIPEKNLDRLVGAYARYVKRTITVGRRPWKLVLVGDGRLAGNIRELISASGTSDYVVLPGFKQYDEIVGFYSAASYLVHASVSDTWGLVVNEAMAAGLPVLVSDRVGCCPDLVQSGKNGYRFDPFDVDALAELMSRVASDDEMRVRMGRESKRIIGCWGLDRFAHGLSEAIQAGRSRSIKRSDVLDHTIMSVAAWR